MNTQDERNVKPIQEMSRIAQEYLELFSRGFKESYNSVDSGVLIFDSKWCRINLTWDGWDYGGGNSITINYGRSHAPNEQAVMIWKGEECRCWHRFEYALHFLDGITPAEAAKLHYSHPLVNPFYGEEVRKQYSRRQPEWLSKMHTTVWQSYGIRLFELFDLRHPTLWDEYSYFLKDVYNIKGRSKAIKPSWDKVC